MTQPTQPLIPFLWQTLPTRQRQQCSQILGTLLNRHLHNRPPHPIGENLTSPLEITCREAQHDDSSQDR